MSYTQAPRDCLEKFLDFKKYSELLSMLALTCSENSWDGQLL